MSDTDALLHDGRLKIKLKMRDDWNLEGLSVHPIAPAVNN